MERITYIAPNMMDWVAQIKAGGATVKVHFTGGALTAYGVTPAEYTTESKFLQQVIERSSYFKEGRIAIGRRVEIPDPVKPKPKAHKPVAAPAPSDKPADAKEPSAETAAPTEAEQPEAEGEKPVNTCIEVEVTCLHDAFDYLQRNFGIASYKVRSKAAAQKAAMERGVMFVGGGFEAPGGNAAEETEGNE